MQYRAIGLVNAVYVPQDDKTLTRGVLRCEDGTGNRSCVAGPRAQRGEAPSGFGGFPPVDLYPRNREGEDLHLQVVGLGARHLGQ